MTQKILDTIDSPIKLRKLPQEKLQTLCKELRVELIESVSQTGGHLGAGLGVVELTVALHYIFNTPKDKIIWDVGHQSYPHKILTQRRDKMLSLRKKDGISGFTKRSESIYDPFGAGHSSTSISAAMGFAMADRLANKDNLNIAVIGDGAMSAGMAYEALNNAGHLKLNNLIIILNDNDMSIAPPTGAMSTYLTKLISSSPYSSIKNVTKDILGYLPKIFKTTAEFAENTAKNVISESSNSNNFFENLGINYLGPIDGHNINNLVEILSNIKSLERTKPILLHVVTKKGYGYLPAENSLDKYHGVTKFNINTGKQSKAKSNKSYTKIFAETLLKLAHKDKKIVAITAAMPDGTGLKEFAEQLPERCFDVGIAEQHAVTFAAGLACQDYKPFVAIYSTFLQRAYDQIIHDVAIQNLPVKFAIDRAGFVGADGATHNGVFDISFLGMLPNFVIMAPSDDQELVDAIYTASLHNKSPIAFRYPRGSALGMALTNPKKIEIGKAKIIKKGQNIVILCLGTLLHKILEAAEIIKKQQGYYPSIIDMRFAKPIDKDIITKFIKDHNVVITIEDGAIGGFSAQVNQYLNGHKSRKNLLIKNLFFPDKFLEQATVEELYKDIYFDSKSIAKFCQN
jgi:1-deoxy-D-xylulose-5-phosphate synthase